MIAKMNASRLAVELTSQIGTSPVVAGMRLPSINELGLKYKVSPATALKAVKTLESKGLVECVRGRGVFLKEQEDTSKLWRVGLLTVDFGGNGIEKEVAFGSYFSGAAESLRKAGRSVTRLLMEDVIGDRAEALKILAGLDGLIVSFSCIDHVTIPLLREWGCPVVVIQHEKVLSLPFHQVIPDLKSGFEKAVRLLDSAEINDLVIVGAANVGMQENRILHFMEAFKESHGSSRISTSMINVEKLPSDTGRLTGRLLGERILKVGKLPDAIFCPSDFLSFGIMDVMMGKGLTPGVDFKLISYDNLEGAGILPFGKPMITSVENPRDSISRQAASLLLNLEKHGAELTHIIRIPCGIVERETIKTI